MATSESTDFELDVSDYIEEAFERCGLEVRTGYDLKTAKRSMNLLFADWANRGLNRWTIEQSTLSITASTAIYSLPADTIDILSAVIRTGTGTSQSDTQITRISRDTFINIPSKNTEAQPSQWYVDRQITPQIRLWPTPDKAYTLVYDRLTRIQDADSATDTLDVPFRFYPCLAAGLAYYLAMKKAPDRIQILKAVYEEEFARAAYEDVDRANLSLVPRRDYYGFG
jgi:hypothetical protein|tara:strand:+ start:20926 stop:21603 length:678 start_codon:yes stop_codon:yes gene_type:complete